jgi:hypothetical protein
MCEAQARRSAAGISFPMTCASEKVKIQKVSLGTFWITKFQLNENGSFRSACGRARPNKFY